jgi:8-oxo-dGTP pyrophosphatase MutT (NUDIX family)/phosphohistidine phosphatase SixA
MGAGRMILAAGGVPYRIDGGMLRVAVVHRPRYDDWSWPKGKAEPGEHPLLTACREVAEETGLRVRLERRLPNSVYRSARHGRPELKTVHYWSMGVSGDPDAPGFTPNSEVDALDWLTVPAAEARLSYDRDREVLAAFAAAPGPHTVVLLLRHGEAGERGSWSGPDTARPLTAVGREQAAVLAAVVPAYRPERVLSAPPARCVETVAPLASRLGRPIETEVVFSEPELGGDPAAAVGWIRKQAALGVPAVMCSQRGGIPRILALIAAEDEVPLPAASAAKGSVWALSFDRECRLAGSEYLPALTPGTPGIH